MRRQWRNLYLLKTCLSAAFLLLIQRPWPAASDPSTTATWRDQLPGRGRPPPLNPTARPCRVVVACNGERLGNAFVNVLLAMHVAQQWRSKLLVDAMCWGYNELLGDMDVGASLHQEWDFSRDPSRPLLGPPTECNGTYFANAFTPQHMPSLTPTAPQLRRMAMKHLYPRLQWGASVREPPLQQPKADDVVIFLRSGDIWGHMQHPSYVQAPCSFLDAVLQHADAKPEHIKIVTDDSAKIRAAAEIHPCLGYLLSHYPGATSVSSTAQADWGFLMHAHVLVVTGVSSFAATAAYLNPNLQRLYTFGWTSSPHPSSGGDLPSDLVYYMANSAIALPLTPWSGLQQVAFLVYNWTDRWNALEQQALRTATLEHSINDVQLLPVDATPLPTLHAEDAFYAYSLPRYTLTLILGCGVDASETAYLVQSTKRHLHPWAPPRGLFASVALVHRQSWMDEVAAALHQEQRYLTVLQEVAGDYPNDTASVMWPQQPTYACQVPPLMQLLRTAFLNPFGTSHLLWAAEPNKTDILYEKVLEWTTLHPTAPLLLVNNLDPIHRVQNTGLMTWLHNGTHADEKQSAGDLRESLPLSALVVADIVALVLPTARQSPRLLQALWDRAVERNKQRQLANSWIGSWLTRDDATDGRTDHVLDVCRLVECTLLDWNWVEVLSKPTASPATGMGRRKNAKQRPGKRVRRQRAKTGKPVQGSSGL